MAELLAACCGYVPVEETINLSAAEMAARLVAELGDLATMDAFARADDSKARGDREAYEFWMDVREEAFELLTN